MLAMELKMMVVITLSFVALVRKCQITAGAIAKNVGECEVDGVKYKDGQSFYIPQNPVQYDDISCQSCTCDNGVKLCNDRITCDYFFPCENFIPAPQGKCCPTCSCQHQGFNYHNGDTWINRHRGACFKCSCVAGQSKCTLEQCEIYCPNPTYEPGKCCPTCYPALPVTNQRPILIPKTTPGLPPVLPPIPGFSGKRGLKHRNKDK